VNGILLFQRLERSQPHQHGSKPQNEMDVMLYPRRLLQDLFSSEELNGNQKPSASKTKKENTRRSLVIFATVGSNVVLSPLPAHLQEGLHHPHLLHLGSNSPPGGTMTSSPSPKLSRSSKRWSSRNKRPTIDSNTNLATSRLPF